MLEIGVYWCGASSSTADAVPLPLPWGRLGFNGVVCLTLPMKNLSRKSKMRRFAFCQSPPQGRGGGTAKRWVRMHYSKNKPFDKSKFTENGYVVATRYYSNDRCGRCPHKNKCHRSQKGYRTVRVNQVLNQYRPNVLEALTSDEGILLRRNRSIQVEGVFGVLKEDYGFRRFLTRGKRNIETQFFLLAFALNIEKHCNRTKKGRIGLDLFALNAS